MYIGRTLLFFFQDEVKETNGLNYVIDLTNTVSNSINSTSFTAINEYYTIQNTLTKQWYFTDNNYLKVKELKELKVRKRNENTFYNDNVNKINNLSVKYHNSRLIGLQQTFNQFGYPINQSNLMDLLKDTKLNIWVINNSILLNYIYFKNDLTIGKNIMNRINTGDEILLHLLNDITNSFDLNRGYTWDEIKTIFDLLVLSKRDYEKYFYSELKNDTFLKDCLRCVFTVVNERKQIDKKRIRVMIFKPFQLDSRYKDIFNYIK